MIFIIWHLVWPPPLPRNTTWAGGLFVAPQYSALMPGGSVVVPCDSLLLCSSSGKRDQTRICMFKLTNWKYLLCYIYCGVVVHYVLHSFSRGWNLANADILVQFQCFIVSFLLLILCIAMEWNGSSVWWIQGCSCSCALQLSATCLILYFFWLFRLRLDISQSTMSQLTFNGLKYFPLRSHSNEHVTVYESKLTQMAPLCQKQVARPRIGWGEGRVLSCPPSFF